MSPGAAHPRVLQLLTRLVGGAAQSAITLSKELQAREFDVHLVTGPEREGDFSHPTDVPHSVVPRLKRSIDPISDFRAFRSVLQIIRRWQPDVLIAHMSKVGVLGRMAARQAGVPVTVRMYHGHVLTGYFSNSMSTAFRLIEKRLAGGTDALVAVSASVKEDLVRLGIGTPSRWHVIPLGMDLQSFNLDGLPKREARRRLGLPLRGPVVGTVGRLTPVKDHRTFLQAAQLVGLQHPTATFVVVGDGELRESLEREARRLLGDKVRFLGWTLDIRAVYAALDVLVLTSREEGLPRVLIEAGAAARPVVATRVGGVSEVVRDGETGLIVAPGSPRATAEATLRFLANPRLASKFGKAARSWVDEEFPAHRFGQGVADLLTQLLAERRVRT